MPFIFKALILSLFSQRFYHDVAHAQKGIGFKFISLLALIGTVFAVVGVYVFIQVTHKADIDNFIKTLPVFTLEKEGGISMDRPSPYIMGDEEETFAIIDLENYNNATSDEIFAMLKEKDVRVLVTKNVIYTVKSNYEQRTYDLSEKREESTVLTHELINSYVDKVKKFAIPVGAVLIFGCLFLYRTMQMLFYSIFGFVVNSMRKQKLESQQIHRIASYALWPAILIGIISTFTGLEFYTIIAILITALYVVYGMISATKAK